MIQLPCPLLLASASPARANVLRSAGLSFTQEASGVHEPPREAEESLEDYVLRLAGYKMDTMLDRHPNACILTCDTVIELDHHTLGKPKDEREAFDMIQMMSGRAHTVHSGVALCSPAPDRKTWQAVDSTQVHFKALTADDIQEYVTQANPVRFAGAYAIQKEGSKLVQKIEGRMDTVIGLPMNQVLEGLEALLSVKPS